MKIIGHRGAKGLAPENTIDSFEKALEHQVNEIELDARLTADGEVVVIHTSYLVDASGNKLKVAEHALSELRTHKPDLPTLTEAINSVNRRVPIVVEVKPGVPTEPVVAIIKAFLKKGWQPKDFLLASFSFKTLTELQAELPDITKVVNDRWSGVRATRRARLLGTKRLAMNRRWLWGGFIAAMRGSGYQLYAYTLNDPAKAKRWAKQGLAGVITDFPDLFEK
ncbi:MAG TPA: glycerophosphodiester phosphodiesterase, partial [Patescibacteria group bacterium]|nr:glycerophosphodiester phosphodiesterase [Patescibacteria group bacterium]